MRVYLEPPQHSLGLERIKSALVRYAPAGIEVVTQPEQAELTVLWAIGRAMALTQQANSLRSKYAVIQVCLRSTQKSSTNYWRMLWQNAEVVWSYYDLNAAIKQDGGTKLWGANDLPNFYHAPLGADAAVFYPRDVHKLFVIASSGLSRLSESVRECVIAAGKVGRDALHIGAQLNLGDNVVLAGVGISDDQLAESYSECEFVSGLRRKEGFELPAIEGLLCGARPVVFDTADYHWNYGDHAEYIHEGSRSEVVDQLTKLFIHGARPVTQDEINQARERFNWETIIGGFWQHIRANS